MSDRHENTRTSLRPRRNPMGTLLTVAAIACLAGTSTGLAQFDNPGGQDDAIRDPMGGSTGNDLSANIKVNEHMLVDLHVNDEDLATVLQMLSIQSQRNIVSSKNVSATVTANLYGVTFHEALDAILHVNGYGYLEQGNFIYVYTLDELSEIQESMRVMEWRVFHLNYISSVDAAEFITPILSEKGQIKTNGKVADFMIPDNSPVGGEDYALDSMLVVHDYVESLDAVEGLLKQIDSRPSQVLVEATILQSVLNEANEFGVDFSIVGSLDFTDFIGIGGPKNVVDGLLTGKGSSLSGGSLSDVALPGDGYGMGGVSSVGNVAGPSTAKLGIVAGDVAAFIRALDQVSDTTIISRPKLITLNRQPARVLVGRKVGYLSTTSTDTATTQTVEFLDTGTQLYFRPFVSNDSMIRMELKPQVSEAVIRNTNDATGAAITIPDEITNELTANVLVRDGQTIVLGGLFREKTETARRQVPFVGDIPIIGKAFQGNDNAVERSEIIFMITPTIVNDKMLLDEGDRATAYVERVRTGAREGLLMFSREKMTAKLNVEAERLATAGEKDKALWKIERSLQLNANQPDAIMMREHLLGESVYWPKRSILDDIISGELDQKHASYPPQSEAIDTGTTEFTQATETDFETTTDEMASETQDMTTEDEITFQEANVGLVSPFTETAEGTDTTTDDFTEAEVTNDYTEVEATTDDFTEVDAYGPTDDEPQTTAEVQDSGQVDAGTTTDTVESEQADAATLTMPDVTEFDANNEATFTTAETTDFNNDVATTVTPEPYETFIEEDTPEVAELPTFQNQATFADDATVRPATDEVAGIGNIDQDPLMTQQVPVTGTASFFGGFRFSTAWSMFRPVFSTHDQLDTALSGVDTDMNK